MEVVAISTRDLHRKHQVKKKKKPHILLRHDSSRKDGDCFLSGSQGKKKRKQRMWVGPLAHGERGSVIGERMKEKEKTCAHKDRSEKVVEEGGKGKSYLRHWTALRVWRASFVGEPFLLLYLPCSFPSLSLFFQRASLSPCSTLRPSALLFSH